MTKILFHIPQENANVNCVGFNGKFPRAVDSPVGLGFNPKQIVIIFIFHELCLYAFFVCPVKKLPKNINI
jgi:hypothetical protein